LLPFCPAELAQTGSPVDLSLLLKRGGFPEPFSAATDDEAGCWRKQYADSLILHYIRTKEGKEVDFCVVADGAVEKMIEVKTSDAKPDKSLQFFHERYAFAAVQLVGQLKKEYRAGEIEIRAAEKFLALLRY